MRRSHCLTTGLLILLGLATTTPALAGPVVAELFTSNSCSSCPPAYKTLDRLVARHQGSDSPIIRLDEHVDYWNQLNWVDRYSKAQFSQRQRHYANEVFHNGQVYTPELVVNGQTGMVGSNDGRAQAAFDRLADTTQPLDVVLHRRGAALVARVHLPADLNAGRVWFAVTQDRVVSHVGAGENAGRTLTENGVVRALLPAGPASTGQSVSKKLPMPDDAKTRNLNAVAFVVNAHHHIVAAGTTALVEH